MSQALALAVALVAGYLLGSVPFGLVLTRLAGHGDIRRIGSGNIGATNVLRTGNKPLAGVVLVLDAGKGAIAAAAGMALWGPDAGLVAGVTAVIGHNFPVWLGFRGGKGVAASLGVLLVTAWPAGLLAVATWLAVAGITRYSSLAALLGLGLAPVYAWFLYTPHAALGALVLALLALVRHRDNIRRLIRREESRITLSRGRGQP